MEFLAIVWIILIVFFLGFASGAWMKEKQLKKNILNAENVINCFKDVDWNIQSFVSNGAVMKTYDGIEHFYKVPPIKDAISKLNVLLNSSPPNTACSGLVESSASQSDSTPEKLSARQASSQPATNR